MIQEREILISGKAEDRRVHLKGDAKEEVEEKLSGWK